MNVDEAANISQDVDANTEKQTSQGSSSEEDIEITEDMVLATPSRQTVDDPEGYSSTLNTSDLGDWSTFRVWDVSNSPYYICEDISKSPVLSPVLNMESWSPNFALSPQLTLGDLAMSGWEQLTPVNELGHWTELNTNSSSVETTSATEDEKDDATPVLSRRHPISAYPLGYPVDDFAAAIGLINRANAALAPFGRFADDAKLLLQELRNLRLQLKLLRKPPPFLAKSTQYYTTVRDVALDIQPPLQAFVERLQPTCDLHYLERLSLNLTPTAFKIRKMRWDKMFCAEAQKLRSMISTRTTTISMLMTLDDRETLTEIHNVLHSNSDDLRVLKEKLVQGM